MATLAEWADTTYISVEKARERLQVVQQLLTLNTYHDKVVEAVDSITEMLMRVPVPPLQEDPNA